MKDKIKGEKIETILKNYRIELFYHDYCSDKYFIK